MTIASTNNTAQSGTWNVSYFFDKKEETYTFTGYHFTFASNGSATASNGTNTINGIWNTGNDDSKVKFVLDFGTQVPFDEISDDWHVISLSSKEIKLQDVSGGSGEIDYLTFTAL